MENQDSTNEQIEYINGLGDLLEEKHSYKFNWLKTIAVFIIIIALILIGFHLTLKLGASLFNQEKPSTQPLPPKLAKEIETLNQPNAKQAAIKNNQKKILKKVDRIATYAPDKKAFSKIKPKPITKKQKRRKKPVPQIKTGKKKLRYKVIVGAFKKKENAKRFARQLKAKRIDTFIWEKPNNDVPYKIQAGAYNTYKEATTHVAELKNKRIDAFVFRK